MMKYEFDGKVTIISGYPFIGKSSAAKLLDVHNTLVKDASINRARDTIYYDAGLLTFYAIDLDSSMYNDGSPNWISNYMRAIRDRYDMLSSKLKSGECFGAVILVSSHKTVRDEMDRLNMDYIYVVPSPSKTNFDRHGTIEPIEIDIQDGINAPIRFKIKIPTLVARRYPDPSIADYFRKIYNDKALRYLLLNDVLINPITDGHKENTVELDCGMNLYDYIRMNSERFRLIEEKHNRYSMYLSDWTHRNYITPEDECVISNELARALSHYCDELYSRCDTIMTKIAVKTMLRKGYMRSHQRPISEYMDLSTIEGIKLINMYSHQYHIQPRDMMLYIKGITDVARDIILYIKGIKDDADQLYSLIKFLPAMEYEYLNMDLGSNRIFNTYISAYDEKSGYSDTTYVQYTSDSAHYYCDNSAYPFGYIINSPIAGIVQDDIHDTIDMCNGVNLDSYYDLVLAAQRESMEEPYEAIVEYVTDHFIKTGVVGDDVCIPMHRPSSIAFDETFIKIYNLILTDYRESSPHDDLEELPTYNLYDYILRYFDGQTVQ